MEIGWVPLVRVCSVGGVGGKGTLQLPVRRKQAHFVAPDSDKMDKFNAFVRRATNARPSSASSF